MSAADRDVMKLALLIWIAARWPPRRGTPIRRPRLQAPLVADEGLQGHRDYRNRAGWRCGAV